MNHPTDHSLFGLGLPEKIDTRWANTRYPVWMVVSNMFYFDTYLEK